MKVPPRPPGQQPRRRSIATLGIAAAILVILGGVASFYTETLWYDEVGYSDVLWTGIRTRLLLAAAFGIAFAVMLLVNLAIARKIARPSRLFSVSDAVLERYRTVIQPYARLAVIGAALVLGLFAGSGASVQWRNWLLFQNATPFGTTDPLFGRDVSFYVFKLPFYEFLFTWLFSTLLIVAIAVAVVHYFLGGIRPQARGGDRVAPEVRAHLSVLLGLMVLVKAWGYQLDQYRLLFSPRGQVTGASYTDVNAELPALRLLVVIAVICAVLFLVNARQKNWVLPLGGIALLALTSVIAGGVYPAAVQRLRVEPNEALREEPYIARNIEATRRAYGLDRVETRRFSGVRPVQPREVRANADIVQNIRLWDPMVLRDAYQQLQRNKQYYEFLDVDVDRYRIGNDLRQVMLAAREIDPTDLSESARTWVNEHLVYTHGYGVAANRVDRVVREGEPDFIVRNLPPQSVEGMEKIEQPQIYFGESETVPFAIVGTTEQELDYPQTDTEFAKTTYAGRGGVQLGGLARRAAFAWRFRDTNILISGAITDESKILYHRKILDRAAKALPFLRLDSDPYVVLADGRLFWMIDAYTTTHMYPYSARVDLGVATGDFLSGRANYMRNSVKIVIDAEHGSIDAYRWDEEDPLAASWAKVFPGLLKDRDELPESLRAHVRYPEGLFRVQSERYGLYHITDPRTFYSKEDAWAVAADPAKDELTVYRDVQPYYVMLRLPGERRMSFVAVRPFTPVRRRNLSAFLIAHSDPDRYGEMISLEFPDSDVIPGPEQAVTLIRGDDEISPQLTLLSQSPSQLIYGNLLIVPIEESLLYVQPLYVSGTGSQTRLPELKKVVVVSGGRIEMADTFPGALAALFGDEPEDETDQPDTQARTVADLLSEAIEADRRAQAALRRGDFAAYGREQARMRRALERAAELAGAPPPSSPAPSPSPTG